MHIIILYYEYIIILLKIFILIIINMNFPQIDYLMHLISWFLILHVFECIRVCGSIIVYFVIYSFTLYMTQILYYYNNIIWSELFQVFLD